MDRTLSDNRLAKLKGEISDQQIIELADDWSEQHEFENVDRKIIEREAK